MLTDGHIFTIRTKDPTNVSAIQAKKTGIEVLGINVLKEQIRVGDFVFVVLGGGKTATPWARGLIAIAHFSSGPYDGGYDTKNDKNFKVKIDIDVLFPPPVTRGDFVTYPCTFDAIGIGPITKWEPNQAIANVPQDKAIALLQAIWEMRPSARQDIENLLGDDFSQISGPVKRFTEMVSPLGGLDLRPEFIKWAPHKKPNKTGKSASEETIEKYVGYLNCLNKPMSGTGNASGSGWDGVVEFMTGHRPEKYYYQVEGLDEFDSMFGVLGKALEGNPAPDGVILANYNQVVSWANTPSIKKHMCLLSAYGAYREFLEWREVQQKKKDEPKLDAADLLTVALKMFAEKRAVDKPSGWDSYDAWTHGVRTDFVAVDNSLLANPTFDYLGYIRKFAISWQVANTKFASHSDDEKHAVLKFLKEHKDSPKPASWYIDVANRLVVGDNQVKGMSPKAVLYFMSELHPEEFAAWTEPTYEQLAYLGLHKGAVPSDLTIETYEDCKAKQHQIIARMKELGIGKASDDPSAPDYRTVNEFLWWLGQDDNKDLIKEEVMSKQLKPVN